jgi:alpha-beta hydrolase superfamily lysophospholipase
MSLLKKILSKKTILRNTQIFIGITTCYLMIALSLIFWPKPKPFESTRMTPEFWETVEATVAEELSLNAPIQIEARHVTFNARDGVQLAGTRYGQSDETLIILMHGIASNRSEMRFAAQKLQKNTGAEIITYDHRGHGDSFGPRSDVKYIGQYEDDLFDVVQSLQRNRPSRKLIIAGHSMGGGVAMRYALKESYESPNAYLLIAPNFGEGPTQRTGSDEAPIEGAPAFVEFDVKRMIGQIMLNSIGLHILDDKPIMYFNYRPHILAYSYRAVMSGQPIRPKTSDIALQAVEVPLLVLVGSDDELFLANEFEGFLTENSEGETRIVQGANHNNVLTNDITHSEIAEWFSTNFD